MLDNGGTFYITVHGTEGTLYLDMEIKRERLLIRLNDGTEINDEIAEGDGTMSYGTKAPLDTFVVICWGKKVDNHADGDVSVKTVKVLDAIYRSMKSENSEIV